MGGEEPPPPPPPPNFPPPPSPRQVPQNVSLPPFNSLNSQGFRLPSPLQFRPSNVEGGMRNVTQTLSGDRLIGELERVIEKNEKEEEKIVPHDTIVDL